MSGKALSGVGLLQRFRSKSAKVVTTEQPDPLYEKIKSDIKVSNDFTLNWINDIK